MKVDLISFSAKSFLSGRETIRFQFKIGGLILQMEPSITNRLNKASTQSSYRQQFLLFITKSSLLCILYKWTKVSNHCLFASLFHFIYQNEIWFGSICGHWFPFVNAGEMLRIEFTQSIGISGGTEILYQKMNFKKLQNIILVKDGSLRETRKNFDPKLYIDYFTCRKNSLKFWEISKMEFFLNGREI